MTLDERLITELKTLHQRLQNEGELEPLAKLQQYYATFRERFGPERLSSLDGEALLEHMHGSGNPDSLVYWLEFKNDDEFPSIFGSISGGSAHKFGLFRSAQTGLWMSGAPQSQYSLSVEEAVELARLHRDQLVRGAALLQALSPTGSDDEYRALQEAMDREAPDVGNTAWGHKYFSLVFPEKVDMFHVEYYQHFHLVKLLQVPPAGSGRYLTAGRFVSAAHQLDISLYHLAVMLKRRHGKPHTYWRILANYQHEPDMQNWDLMRDGGFVGVKWAELGDLSDIGPDLASKQRVNALMKEHYDARGPWPQEVFNFVGRIEVGDVVLAFEKNTVLGIGRVTGPYYFEPSSPLAHRRPVEWLSVAQWETPVDEFSRTNPTVRQVKQFPNLVEVERHLLGAEGIEPPHPPKTPHPVRLTGTEGRIQTILERKGQVILYGPPGTGKTYWAERAARELAAYSVFGRPFADLTPEQQARLTGHYVRLCSFHPSYGYEDFLEGYRPEVVNDQMTFARRDGIFKQVCDAAQAEPDRNFYLLIDEINRGDIPRIFGELLTVLEKDKRGKVVVLPLSETPFQVPKNVYVIGTMNTADRSIALLDTALRRRFGFLELMPDYTVLRDAAVSNIPLALWLEKLNSRLLEHIGRDARNLQIGHAYLLEGGRPVSTFAKFVRVVQEDIIPLLEEYCYEDYAALENILGKGLVDTNTQQIRHELFDPARQDDLVQALIAPSPEIMTSLQAAVAEPPEPDEDEDNGSTDEDA